MNGGSENASLRLVGRADVCQFNLLWNGTLRITSLCWIPEEQLPFVAHSKSQRLFRNIGAHW